MVDDWTSLISILAVKAWILSHSVGVGIYPLADFHVEEARDLL